MVWWNRVVFVAVTATALGAERLAAEDVWPAFRGAARAGVMDSPQLPDVWDKQTNIEWRTPIAGQGWSCPVVWGKRIFLTTVAREGAFDEPKKGLYFGGERKDKPKEPHRWLVLCLDATTGKVLWEREVASGIPERNKHIKNSFASETPVVDARHVYAYFGNKGLYCLDHDGQLVWKKQFPTVATKLGWGTAASPAEHGDRLFIVNDNETESYLVALDKRTGDELWRVPRAEKTNWATPFIWRNSRRTELVTAGTERVRSYDLDGKLLWEFGGMSSITICTPFAADDLLYIASGYVLDKQRPLYAIRPGAAGDITLKAGESSNEFIAWCQKLAAPYNTTPLVYEGRCYVLYDQGFLACYDAKTGREIYGRQRLSAGAHFTASPWANAGKVYCLSEEGDTFVIQAGDTFKLLRKNSLDEMGMSTPALTPERLLLRTADALYSIRPTRK